LPRVARLALLLLAAALPATAQPLYKWVDEQGKTQYSDKPPKGFKGTVTSLETEVDKTTLPPSPPAAPAAPAAAPAEKAAPPKEDIAARRRATRARLEAQLTKARADVEAARKALARAEIPEDDERQVIQQRATSGGMHGMAERSNCRVETDGKVQWLMCPTTVPTEQYRDRVAGLEENLRKAEEGLAAAETAWRRGVD
jgi:hypothetical protein